MIQFLEYKDIDHQKWNDCIDHSFNGLIYAYTWFLDIINDEWAALVEDDYERVMPLPIKKQYGISYLIQPDFCQQLGVFSKTRLDDQVITRFLEHIPKQFKFVQMNLNVHNKLDETGYNYLKRRNIELDLISDYEKLHANYSKNCKRNLKKAKNNELQITNNVQPEKIVELFKDFKAKTLSPKPEFHYMMITRIMYECIYRGIGVAMGVTNAENEIIAAAFFIHHKQRIIFLFSGINDEARKKLAMTALIDAHIKEYAGKNIVFDFEGSVDPALAYFYNGFGSKETVYYQLIMNRFMFPIKQMVNYLKKLPRK